MTCTVLVSVQTVRSQNPNGRGGCIFVGTQISETGNVLDAKSYFVVMAMGLQLGECRVQTGQWWRVTGEEETYNRTVNGYCVVEKQIRAAHLLLEMVSGEHIVSFLSGCAEFHRIGILKARKLWSMFGNDLYRLLNNGEVQPLSRVLTAESARQVIDAWVLFDKIRTLQWLKNAKIDVRVGHRFIKHFGSAAHTKLEEDPYRLLSFSASWKQVDALACVYFNMPDDDPRRLQGAIEEALYRLLGDGHTRPSIQLINSHLKQILGGSSYNMGCDVLKSSLSSLYFRIGKEENLWSIGAWAMEASVARAIKIRLANHDDFSCRHYLCVESVITEHELNEGIALNNEQRSAVHVAASNSISLIIGGAEVGKTTVLKALYKVFDETQTKIFQVAMSGRAAMQMLNDTARPVLTMANFLRMTKEDELAGRCVIVVDEASMVDIITMNRLCELLPDHVRIVLVGDTEQLMPVGPGLVLHAMERIPQIPKFELKSVIFQGNSISIAARALRSGIWPKFSDDPRLPISFIPCSPKCVGELVVRNYRFHTEDTQILSTRRTGLDGTKAINALVQAQCTKAARPLLVYSEEFQSMVGTGYYLGDKIFCTRNLWDWGLQNGSMGRLVKIEDKPLRLSYADGAETGEAIGWILWDDGERRPILESMLNDLELGNAITVHEAQGSHWRHVIVVLSSSKMLDRSLVYTAITRAQQQVILIGDPVAARLAVETLPRVTTRMTGLDALL